MHRTSPRRAVRAVATLAAASAVAFAAPVVVGAPVLAPAAASQTPLTALELRGELAATDSEIQPSYLGPGATRLFVDGQDGQSVRADVGVVTGAPELVLIGAHGWRTPWGTTEEWSLTLPRDTAPGTYRTTRAGDASTGALPFDLYGAGRGCNQLPGELTVHEAEWAADGRPIRLALDFSVHCERSDAPATVGSLRWASTVPFARAVDDYASPVPSTYDAVQVGQSAQIRVHLTGKTPDPVTFGSASLLHTALSRREWALTEDGCAGVTVAFGAGCDIVVTLTPIERGTKRVGLLVPDGTSQPMPIMLAKEATAQPGRPMYFSATGLLGRIATSWGGPVSSPQPITSYVVEVADQSVPGGWRQVARTVGADGQGYVLGDLRPGATATYSARAVYADGTFGPRSATSTATVARRELDSLGYGLEVQALDPPGPAITVDGGTRSASQITFSPSGRYVAYVERFGPIGPITVRDLYGQQPSGAVTGAPDGIAYVDAAYADDRTLVVTRAPTDAPDQRSLALVRQGTGALTTESQTVIANSDGLTDPAVAEPGPRPVIVAAAMDGSGLVRITSDGVRTPLSGTVGGHDPAVSRQGRIAFVVRRADGADELRIRATDGT